MAALVLTAACGRQDAPIGDAPPGVAVDEYRQFVEAELNGAGDPTVIADGLRRLAGALGERSVGSPDLWVDLRVTAEHVLLNPTAPATAESVRSTWLGVAEALRAEGLRADGLRAAAESMDPDQPLQAQGDTIARCFREAAAALEG